MKEEFENDWLERSFAVQYMHQLLEQIRGNYKQNENRYIEYIEFDRNYGYLIKTQDVLRDPDVDALARYFVAKLTSVGYRLVRHQDNTHHLQASVKLKVRGEQLYGNIRIVKKKFELHILVSSYSGSQFSIPDNHQELMEMLLSAE